MPKKVAIVGGGIAGISAAYYLSRTSNVSTVLFERSSDLGGALETTRENGFLIEHSGDMFVTDPDDAIQLCRELQFEDQLIETNRQDRFSSIVHRGRLVRIPAGFSLMSPNQLGSVLRSELLSAVGKLRFLSDFFLRPRTVGSDESLKSFATRHYGVETFERIIQPLVAGIYSARADQLSMHATMKRFVDMEREHGSLIRAAMAKRRTSGFEESSGARYGMFVAPKYGMGSLVKALIDRLHDVEIKTGQVEQVCYRNRQWEIDSEDRQFDGLICAASASTAARVLNLEGALREKLATISTGSMLVVTVACDDRCFAQGRPRGFGFVVPEVENRNLIACSFAANKFAGRAPEGEMLLRCFVGGRSVEKWRSKSDQELIAMVQRELGELIGFESDTATQYRVFRWLDCMPQYHVGHLELVREIQEEVAQFPGLQLAGCSYDGVGIPACIASGRRAAEYILELL